MRVKPWPIIIIALVHILAPVFNVILSATLNGVEVLDYLEFLIYNKKPIENIFWIVLPVVTGLSILRFRKWSYFLLLTFTSATSILFLFEWIASPKFPLEVFVLLESVNVIIFIYFLLPPVRNVYLNPSLRWWEQKPRYLVDFKTQLESKSTVANGVIKNISVGGALIQTPMPLNRSDIFDIKFEAFQKEYQIRAQVIFKADNTFGSFFIKVSPSQKDLNELIDNLVIQGFPLRTPVPTLKQSFITWIKELLRGRGFVPRRERRDS